MSNARTNEQIVAEYKRRFEEKGLTIMPQYGAIPAHATQLAKGNEDTESWIAFEVPTKSDLHPCKTAWHYVKDDTRSFDFPLDPKGSNIELRCRAWFEGDI